MVFKINLGYKGKSWKFELDSESLIGKKIGDKLQGQELKSELSGCELEITGTSDKAGFAGSSKIDGSNLKRVLLTKGFGLKSRPRKEGKRKKRKMAKGFRLKKTLRGNTVGKDTIQINMKVIKPGKAFEEIFPEQNKPKEKPAEQQAATTQAPPETKSEEKKE